MKKLAESPSLRDANRSNNTSTIQFVDAAVISIGNITTGGTGKTPFVIWLAKMLRETNKKIAIVSRGYARPAGRDRNDEAIEIDSRLPGVPHLQSPDRLTIARRAIREYGAEVILLDDGFQHRRLHRDLDIVLIDATNPFGYGRLLPRGLLREPISGLRRSQAIVLNRCELISHEDQQDLLRQLSQLAPQAVVSAIHTIPTGWLAFPGVPFPLEKLHGTPLMAFCGVGNPGSFFMTLRRLNMQVVKEVVYPDHHDFTARDLQNVAAEAKRHSASAIVCTHKDLVKVERDHIDDLPVYALLIENTFVSGEEDFKRLVLQTLSRKLTCPTDTSTP
jgi:tetraacyldisaccharide 4'-kinase